MWRFVRVSTLCLLVGGGIAYSSALFLAARAHAPDARTLQINRLVGKVLYEQSGVTPTDAFEITTGFGVASGIAGARPPILLSGDIPFPASEPERYWVAAGLPFASVHHESTLSFVDWRSSLESGVFMLADRTGTAPSVPIPLWPRWSGFAANTLIYAGLALFALCLVRYTRRHWRVRRRLCPECGYPRSPHDACPECGLGVAAGTP